MVAMLNIFDRKIPVNKCRFLNTTFQVFMRAKSV